ncbi:MAG: nuclear transport factor 2 family protein [Deltaproteobacteria bacterium]|nr:nuclear transport factor 2 family protein [Deltaproteobacteria bacterium]
MSMTNTLDRKQLLSRMVVTVFAILLLLTPTLINAEDKPVTQATLLDRILIEDMIVKYYVDMSAGKSHDLALYYTEDAVLDVNGVIAKGRNEIEKMYTGLGDSGESAFSGKMHMLLNNAIINVDGNTATAWVIWTGVINEDIKKPPRFLEQGREFDELVKINGRWYITKRYITADSGAEMWMNTYKPRTFR